MKRSESPQPPMSWFYRVSKLGCLDSTSAWRSFDIRVIGDTSAPSTTGSMHTLSLQFIPKSVPYMHPPLEHIVIADLYLRHSDNLVL